MQKRKEKRKHPYFNRRSLDRPIGIKSQIFAQQFHGADSGRQSVENIMLLKPQSG